MVSASAPDHMNRSKKPNSHFQQTICLADWWLFKSENDFQGRRLAVAGFTSREKQAMRVFSSAPILKRYDVFTLETTDGICVILKGLINKVRTVENGFPSDVSNHFVFGFPPYWKEYYEKFMDKESPSHISGVILLKEELLMQSETIEDVQQHTDDCEKDLGSLEKIDVKGMRKSKKSKSSVVPLLQFDSISGSGERNHILGAPLLKNNMKPLSDSSFGESINISAVTDKDFVDPQICDRGGVLSSFHLSNCSRSQKVTDNLRMVELEKKNSLEANFANDMSSSKEILSHSEGRARRHSVSSLKMKQNASARTSGGTKIRLNPVPSLGSEKVELASVDCGSGGRKKLIFEDKDLRKVTKGNMPKAEHKSTGTLSTPVSAQKDNVTIDKNCYSEKSKESNIKTKRKLAYVTPNREKEKGPSASPQSLSFNRSRSGRLLMPTLEFWRNQRAIYDADRSITGIEEGIGPKHPRRGRGSKA